MRVPPWTSQETVPLADEAIVRRVLEGDRALFELLMRRRNQRLYRVARAVLRDDLEAEDVVQETWVRAFAHLGRFEGRARVATWLTRIAFHEALRRRRRRRPESLDEGLQPAGGRFATGPARSALEHAETRTMLTDAFEALPEGQRVVLMLRLVEELSTRETARSLGLSESNVKVTLHRAKAMLLEALQRHAGTALREQFTFGAQRCDRVVAAVMSRIL